jgi:nucleoside-diphosphate-sugar epimerase
LTRVLVTGGGGFIGSNLVRALLERGDDVRVLDNFSTGNRRNILDITDDIEIVEGELRSYERVHNAVRGVEVVFHLGALPSVPRSVQDPLTSSAVTIEGTLNVLLAARDESVRRVVYASSSSVYGNGGTLPRVETAYPDPISPYAVAKLAAEKFCTSFSRVYGLETVALRYFNVFGPRQDPLSQYAAVIPNFITAALEGGTIRIFGDGEQSRDFTYVENVVDVNLAALSAEGVSGRAYNVACGERISLNELVKQIALVTGRELEPSYEEPRPGDVRHSLADISAAVNDLDYAPRVDLEEGIRRTLAFYESATPA